MNQFDQFGTRAAALLALVEDHAPVGWWTWRAGASHLFWSEGMLRIAGIPGTEEPPELGDYRSVVHPDDQHLFADFAKVFTDEWLKAQTCRIVRRDGFLRRVSIHGRLERTPAGVVAGANGIVIDITGLGPALAPAPASAGLSHEQVRAARAWLGWTAQELADKAGVSFSTVRRVEAPGPRAVRSGNLDAIRDTFIRHGVRFLAGADGSVAVLGPLAD